MDTTVLGIHLGKVGTDGLDRGDKEKEKELIIVLHYELIKRELKIRHICWCWYLDWTTER